MSSAPSDPSLFINRELSWLEFNQRVLDQALDARKPLLARLRFLVIVSTNLDEFFRIRVAGLQRQLGSETVKAGPDGLTSGQQLAAVSARAQRLVRDQRRCLLAEVLPALEKQGVRMRRHEELSAAQQAWLAEQFRRRLFPVLTPLARGATALPRDAAPPPRRRPQDAEFPYVRNRTVNLLALLAPERGDPQPFVVVEAPSSLPRFFWLPDVRTEFVLLEEVIRAHIGELCPGRRVIGCFAFCLSRDADLEYDEDVEDLLGTVEQELAKREWGDPVRLEVADACSPEALALLQSGLALRDEQIYRLAGPLRLQDLLPITELTTLAVLDYAPFTPPEIAALRRRDDLFAAIREGDILLWHPYESFDTVVSLVERAAVDPDVLAIKLTLYRTSGDSPVIAALARAAGEGKQVTAVIELRARFDEERNINWARQLEQSGATVVFGQPRYKTHCKALLIVRGDGPGGELRHYTHLGTGNYHPATARLYTDLGLLTCDAAIGEDVSRLFNALTGYSRFPEFQRLIVAPRGLRETAIAHIGRETEHARAGRPARIIARMNSLVDADVIRALYGASQAGVEIDLLVRGICCLRPGVPDVSERIRVTSIVGRFLEHARAFYFRNGGDEEVYLASADWMPRNFDRRVETMFPILAPALRRRVVEEILGQSLADTRQAYRLQADGQWARVQPAEGDSPLDSQEWFLAEALRRHGPPPAPFGPNG